MDLIVIVVLVLVLVLVGFLVWLLTAKVPMPPYWASAIQIIVLILVILYLMTRIRIPNLLP